MPDRLQHQSQVLAFLRRQFPDPGWELSLPTGYGNETYFAHSRRRSCFIKLGAQIDRYQAMASMGLAPPVLASTVLEDGASLLVQPYVEGRRPDRKDYRFYYKQIAAMIDQTHRSPQIMQTLPAASSERYDMAGLAALQRIRRRWETYKPQVPAAAGFVDQSLAELEQQVRSFHGAGLVASHNDICNANWIITAGGQIYLLDFESMALDDPACDIGATLWWYYPPELRPAFLEQVGYAQDEPFQVRMRVRMALHCLDILVPRDGSFDTLDADAFADDLIDFKAALGGKENPQGYAD